MLYFRSALVKACASAHDRMDSSHKYLRIAEAFSMIKAGLEVPSHEQGISRLFLFVSTTHCRLNDFIECSQFLSGKHCLKAAFD